MTLVFVFVLGMLVGGTIGAGAMALVIGGKLWRERGEWVTEWTQSGTLEHD